MKEWTEGNLRRRRIETPYGTLQETWTWLPESFAEAPTEHLIKSNKDLPAYRFMHENTRYAPDYAFAEKRRAAVDQSGSADNAPERGSAFRCMRSQEQGRPMSSTVLSG